MLKSAFLTIFLISIFVSSTFAAPAEEKALTKKHPGKIILFISFLSYLGNYYNQSQKPELNPQWLFNQPCVPHFISYFDITVHTYNCFFLCLLLTYNINIVII